MYFRQLYSNIPDALVLREEPIPEMTDQEMADVQNEENREATLQAYVATTHHTLDLRPLIGARARATGFQLLCIHTRYTSLHSRVTCT
jgi:hypothetical protein